MDAPQYNTLWYYGTLHPWTEGPWRNTIGSPNCRFWGTSCPEIGSTPSMNDRKQPQNKRFEIPTFELLNVSILSEKSTQNLI